MKNRESNLPNEYLDATAEWDFSPDNLPKEDLLACYLHEFGREAPKEQPIPFCRSQDFPLLKDRHFSCPFLALPRDVRHEMKKFLLEKQPAFSFGTVIDMLTLLWENLTEQERKLLGLHISGKTLSPGGEADIPSLLRTVSGDFPGY